MKINHENQLKINENSVHKYIRVGNEKFDLKSIENSKTHISKQKIELLTEMGQHNIKRKIITLF